MQRVALRRLIGALLSIVAATATSSAFIASPASAETPYLWISNGDMSNRCIGIANGLAGAWRCTDTPDQKWKITDECLPYSPGQPAFCRIHNQLGQYLAVNGGSLSTGARILGYPYTDSLDQYWGLTYINGGVFFRFINARSYLLGSPNTAVGIDGGRLDNGAAVIQWFPDGSNNQEWKLKTSI